MDFLKNAKEKLEEGKDKLQDKFEESSIRLATSSTNPRKN